MSVNPARSTGPALFAGADHVAQLWLFWLAPLLGAAIGGFIYPIMAGDAGTRVIDTQTQPGLDADAPVEPLGERAA